MTSYIKYNLLKTATKKTSEPVLNGINYFADLRMTFRKNFFLQDWFRNRFGVGLGYN